MLSIFYDGLDNQNYDWKQTQVPDYTHHIQAESNHSKECALILGRHAETPSILNKYDYIHTQDRSYAKISESLGPFIYKLRISDHD